MFWAHLDTTHFSFDAFDQTAPGAMAALNKGCIAHCRLNKLEWSEFRREYMADVLPVEVTLGTCWIDRDHEIAVPPRRARPYP